MIRRHKSIPSPTARVIGLTCILLMIGLPSFGQIDSSFREDPQRLIRVWEERLPPEDYQKAYDSIYAPDSNKSLRYPFDWYATGPIGKQGVEEIQGRVDQITFLEAGGGSYNMYVGACGGGIWKSAETPVEWTDLGTALPNPSVGAVAPVIDYPDSIYVGSGEYGRYGGAGMYLTTNGGINWNSVSLPVWPGCFYRIYDLDNTAGSMVAACESGIFHTTDKSSWARVHNGLCTDLAVDPVDYLTQYACAYDPSTRELTVYRSTTGGSSWTRVPGAPTCIVADPDYRFSVRGSIAICYGATQYIAVMLAYLDVTADPWTWTLAGVWRSPDDGTTWDDFTTGDLDGFGWGQLFHAQTITFRPYNPDEIYMGGVILAVTDDGGVTWDVDFAENGIDIGHADIADLRFRGPDADTLWMMTDGGLFIHDLSVDSTISYNGDEETGLNIFQIDFMDAERGFWAMGLQDDGVFTSTNGAASWLHHGSSDGGDVEITDNEAHKWWFSAGMPFRILRGTVGGSIDVVTGQIYDSYIQHFFFDRYAGKVYTSDTAYIYSADAPGGGASISPAFHLNPFDKSKSSIFGDYVDGKTIYATYWEEARISVCQKNGGWTCVERDLSSTNVFRVATVTASPQNTREAWAGLHSASGAAKVLHTDDAWASWEDVTGATGHLRMVGQVHTIVVTPFNENQIFVGTDLGVFWTQDGGDSWSQFMAGMPVVRCSDMRYLIDTAHTGADYLAAATYGHGTYKRRLLGDPIVFVDKRNTTGVEDGTLDHPYNTLDEGITNAPVGAIVAIHADTYPVPTPPVVSKALRFESYESSALIGVSSK